MSNKEKESSDFQEIYEGLESLINKVIKSSKESFKDCNPNKKVGKEAHENGEEFTPSLENRVDSLEVVQNCLIDDVNHLKDSLEKVSHLLENISSRLSEQDNNGPYDPCEDCCEYDMCDGDIGGGEEEDGEFPITISDIIESLESLRDDYEEDGVEKVVCTFGNKKSPYGKGYLIRFNKI